MIPIVFDLDGTLIDSAPDIHAAAAKMQEEAGLAPLDLPRIRSFIGNGVPVLVERIMEAHGLGSAPSRHAALTARFLAHYDAAPAALTRPYAHVPEMLAELAAAGHPLGICTNKPAGPARAIVLRLIYAGPFPDPAAAKAGMAEIRGLGFRDAFVWDRR
ncbi:HAD hydrolase-like protein [Mangrovicoccus ximenensis]|uniref:HAD hydrolase-like protein n=1 Tax=Mangrovicoccus ximenensis TaxID=1911570 RepID=UPI001374A999|nr:HAD hydrolase-like protein [Mangrovicoccus ximenensis]